MLGRILPFGLENMCKVAYLDMTGIHKVAP